jgi:hypothetical protein
MKRHHAMLAAVLVVGVTAATTAAARDSFAVSIAAPGFGVGYATGGPAYAVVAPPVVAPPAVYVYPAPVVYGPRFAGYYGPYWHRYWRR